MNRREFSKLLLAGLASSAATPAFASRNFHMTAIVSIQDQLLYLYEDDQLAHEWRVSTARKGKSTPLGIYRPYWLSKDHRSSIYNNAPMPYAVFYDGDFAIHGTYETERLGRRASQGCVRLDVENAKYFYEEVERLGMRNVTIEIVP